MSGTSTLRFLFLNFQQISLPASPPRPVSVFCPPIAHGKYKMCRQTRDCQEVKSCYFFSKPGLAAPNFMLNKPIIAKKVSQCRLLIRQLTSQDKFLKEKTV